MMEVAAQHMHAEMAVAHWYDMYQALGETKRRGRVCADDKSMAMHE